MTFSSKNRSRSSPDRIRLSSTHSIFDHPSNLGLQFRWVKTLQCSIYMPSLLQTSKRYVSTSCAITSNSNGRVLSATRKLSAFPTMEGEGSMYCSPEYCFDFHLILCYSLVEVLTRPLCRPHDRYSEAESNLSSIEYLGDILSLNRRSTPRKYHFQ